MYSSEGAWAVPDPTGERVALTLDTRLAVAEIRTGEILWDLDLGEEPESPWTIAHWHPDAAGLALSIGQFVLAVSQLGTVTARIPVDAQSLFFSPTGRALYLWEWDQAILARHPRTLEAFGESTPWGLIYAQDDRNELLVARPAESPGFSSMDRRLYSAGSGELLADLELPEAPSDESETSRPAFAFVPGGHGVWACWVVEMPREIAEAPGLGLPGLAPVDGYVAVLRCRRWDDEGHQDRDFSVLVPERPQGTGPLSFIEDGPELVVTPDERLVVTYGRFVYVVGGSGQLLHAFEDVGIEAVVDSVAESPDGRGVALVSPIALGWFTPDALPLATRCPGFFEGSRLIRFVEGQPRLYSARFECRLGEDPVEQGAILGVSSDASSLVVGRGDLYSANGEVLVRNGAEEHRLEGLRAYCQNDGCGPEGWFVPGDRYLVIEGNLFEVSTGRRVRELREHVAGVSPQGRYFWTPVDEGAGVVDRGVRVEEVRTGRQVMLGEVGSPDGEEEVASNEAQFDEEEYARRYPQGVFSDDERWLVVAGPLPDAVRLSAIDLRTRRFVWRHTIPGTYQGLGLRGDQAVIVTTSSGQGSLRQLRLRQGATPGEPVALGPNPLLSAKGDHVAWCAAGRLTGLEVETGARRELGPCAGQLLLVGRRFVVVGDGALARVTRWDDGESLRFRVAIRPGRDAWAVAEDDPGNWLAAPGASDLYRRRATGPIWEAAVVSLATAPARDPELLQRFFGQVASVASPSP